MTRLDMEVTSMLGAVQALIGITIYCILNIQKSARVEIASSFQHVICSILQRCREKKGGTCYLYKSTSTRRSSPNVFSLGISDL